MFTILPTWGPSPLRRLWARFGARVKRTGTIVEVYVAKVDPVEPWPEPPPETPPETMTSGAALPIPGDPRAKV